MRWKRLSRTSVERAALLLLGVLTLADPAGAQERAFLPGLVVSAEWLRSQLGDPRLVLLHVGDEAEFEREHLPGARLISLDQLSMPRTGARDEITLQMAPAAQIRSALEGLGVSDDSRVVVYSASNGISPTTRVVFALDFAGLGAQTAVLDGGLQEWKRQGGPVTAEVGTPARGRLSERAPRDLIVDAGWVRDRLGSPGVVVVDARASEFYDGTREGGPRLGHIAGAVSLPFSQVTDSELRFVEPARLRALFESAGVRPGDTVVAYCHIGQQATAVLFAARLLGYDVRLYDGSFQEWSRRPELPVRIPR